VTPASILPAMRTPFLDNSTTSPFSAITIEAAGTPASCASRACAACMRYSPWIGITAFGLALRNRGWRVVSLGAAARVTALAEVAAALSPEIVVLSLGKTRLSRGDQGILRALGEHLPVAIAGRAANPALAAALGLRHLAGDPVNAASDVVAKRDGGVHSGRSLAVSA